MPKIHPLNLPIRNSDTKFIKTIRNRCLDVMHFWNTSTLEANIICSKLFFSKLKVLIIYLLYCNKTLKMHFTSQGNCFLVFPLSFISAIHGHSIKKGSPCSQSIKISIVVFHIMIAVMCPSAHLISVSMQLLFPCISELHLHFLLIFRSSLG